MVSDARNAWALQPRSTRRSLVLAGVGFLATQVAMPSKAAGIFSAIIPGGNSNEGELAVQTLANSSFSHKREPTVSSQNARQVYRPGKGPDIPQWPKPGETRQIWVRRPSTGEEVVARYYDHGQINMDEYLKVCRLMRDAQAGVAAYIDIEMLDLVFAMQKWLVSWGVDKPILVQSGYRSLATNMGLEGAAKNSLHLRGQALDIRMPGVPVAYLGRLASMFGIGGVGFYINKNFVHTDTGTIRYWTS